MKYNSELNNAIVRLAYEIQKGLRPHLGSQASKQVAGKSASGDEEFTIDEIAEEIVDNYLRRCGLPVAYYSEGRGLVEFGNPEYLLIIDPIDGTRPAMVGLEGGVVSIAVAPYSPNATMSDVFFGCVLELKADRLFTAVRGCGASFQIEGTVTPIQLTPTQELNSMSWSFEIAGRPSLPVLQILSSLVDGSSLRGGVFVISSTAFSLTRLVSGQFDAVVDIGNRLYKERPELHDAFVKAGNGTVMGLFPYDIAAAALIAEESGCIVTDAYGQSLGPTPLLDTSTANVRSCIAASNKTLHEKLLAEINRAMSHLSEPD